MIKQECETRRHLVLRFEYCLDIGACDLEFIIRYDINYNTFKGEIR